MGIVERVARAICEADRDNIGYDPDTYEPMARAAIEAMREPTENMLIAPVAQDADWSSERDLIWKGMIDASLGEG